MCLLLFLFFKKTDIQKNHKTSILPDRNPLKNLISNTLSEGLSQFCSEIFRAPPCARDVPASCSPFSAAGSRPSPPPGGIRDHSWWQRAAGRIASSWSCLCALLGVRKVPLVNLCRTRLPGGCSFDPIRRFRMGPQVNGCSCSKDATRLSHRMHPPIRPVCFHIYFATGVENLWQVVIDGTVLLWR